MSVKQPAAISGQATSCEGDGPALRHLEGHRRAEHSESRLPTPACQGTTMLGQTKRACDTVGVRRAGAAKGNHV